MYRKILQSYEEPAVRVQGKHFANREQNMIKQKAETNKQLHHLHAWLTPTPLCQVTNNFSLKQNFCVIESIFPAKFFAKCIS